MHEMELVKIIYCFLLFSFAVLFAYLILKIAETQYNTQSEFILWA